MRYNEQYTEWSDQNPFKYNAVMTKYFGSDILYVPDTLDSGKRTVAETDFTHKVSRLRSFVLKGIVWL